MKSLICIILVVSVLNSASLIAATPTETFKKLSVVEYKMGFKKTLDSISNNERDQLVLFLKEARRNRERAWPVDSAIESMLLNIGDSETITETAKTILTDPNPPLFFAAASPKIVVATAPYLFIEESFHPKWDGDYIIHQVSFGTVIGLKEHLARSPYYTPAVNQWAKTIEVPARLKGAKANEFERNIMRRWWTANKDAFFRGDYLSVKPGETYPEAAATPAPEASSSPIPVAIPTLPVATVSPVPVHQPHPANRFPYLAVIALSVAALLTVGAYLFWRRRK